MIYAGGGGEPEIIIRLIDYGDMAAVSNEHLFPSLVWKARSIGNGSLLRGTARGGRGEESRSRVSGELSSNS